jgi:hypothetical protein
VSGREYRYLLLTHYLFKIGISHTSCGCFNALTTLDGDFWNVSTQNKKLDAERVGKFAAESLIAIRFFTAYSVIYVRGIYFCSALY